MVLSKYSDTSVVVEYFLAIIFDHLGYGYLADGSILAKS